MKIFLVLIELPATVFNIVDIEYAYSRFFIEQLQAFEVWLKFGIDKTSPPQQLPVLLQVLLSQVFILLIVVAYSHLCIKQY